MAEEIKVIITADDSDLVNSFDNLSNQAQELDDSAKDLSKSINDGFSNTKKIDNYSKSVNTASKDTAKLAKETEKTAKSSERAAKATTAFGRALSVLGGAGRKVGNVLRLLASNPLIAAFTVLVGVVTTLFKAFTSTKEGAEALQRATAFLGAALDVLRDLAVTAGKGIVKAFQDPVQAVKDLGSVLVNNVLNRFKGIIELAKSVGSALKAAFDLDLDALKQAAGEASTALTQVATGLDAKQQQDLADSIKNTANEISREAAEAARLTGILQGVVDEQRRLSVQRAKLNAELVKARNVANDANTPLLERIKLIDDITKKETAQLNKEISAQSKRVQALKAIAAQSDSNKQTLDEIAQAEIKLANLRAQSEQRLLAVQRTRTQLQKQAEDRAKKAAEFELMLRDSLVKKEEERLKKEAEAQKKARDQRIKDLFAGDANEAKRKELLAISEKTFQDQITEIQANAIAKREADKKAANNKELQEALTQQQLRAEAETFNLEATLELERQKFAEVSRTEEEITAFEEEQNKKRLESQLKFQLEKLKATKKFSKDATDLEKKRLDEEIKLLEAQLKGIGTTIKTKSPEPKEGQGLFGLLGIDADTQKDVQAIQGALEQVTAEVSKAVAQRIATLQKEIDFRSERIGELQKDLSNEIALNEAGKASNIANVQDQLDQEKAARAKAEREKKEAAKAQFAIDTALQASNLITAISGLYSSLSGLPFGIGVALATALSGVLIGTFIASKTQAANAAGFYEGTENVGKALGKSNATFAGKDGYLGFVGDKQFRFDGDERILNPSQNAALGNMSNEDLVNNALLGAAIPSSSSLAIKNTNLQRNINRNNRENKRQALANSSKAIKEAINGQNSILKEQLKAIQDIPEVAQIAENKIRIKKGNKTEFIKWS